MKYSVIITRGDYDLPLKSKLKFTKEEIYAVAPWTRLSQGLFDFKDVMPFPITPNEYQILLNNRQKANYKKKMSKILNEKV